MSNPGTPPLNSQSIGLQWVDSALLEYACTSIALHDNEIGLQKRRSTISVLKIFMWPGMRQLPCPVQLLVVLELRQAEKMCEEGVEPFELDIDEETGESSCDCVFFRSYNLSCRHFWQQEILYRNLLTSDMWARYGFMWEDCGFEIYESIGTEYIANDLDKEIGAPEQRRLKVWKVLESLRTWYYSLEKDIETQGVELDVRDGVIRLWIRGLAGFMSTMGSKDVEDLMKEYKTLGGLKVDNSEVD